MAGGLNTEMFEKNVKFLMKKTGVKTFSRLAMLYFNTSLRLGSRRRWIARKVTNDSNIRLEELEHLSNIFSIPPGEVAFMNSEMFANKYRNLPSLGSPDYLKFVQSSGCCKSCGKIGNAD